VIIDHTTPVFELNLHFGPNFTPVKFPVSTSNSCNAIVLTCGGSSSVVAAMRFYGLTKQTLQKYSQPLLQWFTRDVSATIV